MQKISFCLINLSLFFLFGCSNKLPLLTAEQLIESAQIRTKLGLAYLEQGQKDKAIKNLELAYQYAPENLDVNMALAHYYTQINDVQRADDIYRAMLKTHQNNLDLMNNYAVFLCRFNQMQRSEQIFDTLFLLKSSMNLTVSYVNAGLCAQKSHNEKRAKAMYTQALLRNPEHLVARQQLANLQTSN